MEAQFCHEHISQYDCDKKPQNFNHTCVWDTTNDVCKANCTNISNANCYGESKCFYQKTGETYSCVDSSNGCRDYDRNTESKEDRERCSSQYGCVLIGTECNESLCEGGVMQVVVFGPGDPEHKNPEPQACKSNTQCDWHWESFQNKSQECNDTVSETDCTTTKRDVCVFNGGSCMPRFSCRHKLWGHAAAFGVNQCAGFGEVECGERVVCAYDRVVGCVFKGDGSLVTKVGRRTTVAMVVLLLLFIFF